MSVSREDVDRIASLARLRLRPEESHRMVGELNSILTHVDALSSADVEGVEPYTVGPDAAPLREPSAVPPDALLRGPADFAPDWRQGLFAVPRLPGLGTDSLVEEGG